MPSTEDCTPCSQAQAQVPTQPTGRLEGSLHTYACMHGLLHMKPSQVEVSSGINTAHRHMITPSADCNHNPRPASLNIGCTHPHDFILLLVLSSLQNADGFEVKFKSMHGSESSDQIS